MAGLGGFAGAFAGNPAGAFQDSRKKQQGLDQGDVDAQAQAAAGNAYMGMFGQQQTPGAPPQGGMPGQPQQGMAPQHGLLQALVQKLQGMGGGMQPQPQQPMMQPPGPGGGQPGPGGPPPGLPQQGAVPGARPMQPIQGAPQQPPGPGMGMQQPPVGQPMSGQQSPMGGMQPGQLNWQSVVQSVVKANPGVKDPRVIAAAVDKFLPLMSQQTQQQWKEMSLMLRQQQVDLGEQRLRQQGDLGQQRIDLGTKREEGVEKRSERREDRLERAMVLKQDQQTQVMAQRREQLENQIKASKDRNMLGQWRALLNAEHARAQEVISSAAASMDPKERQRLLAEQDKFYTDKIKEMKAAMEGGDKPQGSITGKSGEQIMGDGAPTKVKTPEEAAKLKPGTRYTTPDGTEYTR